MKPPMRWDELDYLEQHKIIQLVNHLASFEPDSSERALLSCKIRAAALYNPFLETK